MKNILLPLATALLATLPVMADINTMNYQAVINEADGKPAAEKNIGIRFAIVSGESTLMSEETVLTSDAAGMVKYQIGSTLENGLSNIDWTANDLILQVGIDLNGGTDYSSAYSSTIQSVPTAMYAGRSGDSDELRNLIYRSEADIESLKAHVTDLVDKTVTRDELNDVRYMLDATIKNLETSLAAAMSMIDENTMRGYDNMQRIEILNAENDRTRDDFNQLEKYLYELNDRIMMLEERMESLSNR